MSDYHEPVLAQTSVEQLIFDNSGSYVDATFGGGGHSRLILNELHPDGRLYAFDQDADVLPNLPDDTSGRFQFIPHNFRHLRQFMRLHGHRADSLHGIFADLGVSSHQFDAAERGFSFRFDAELDMRMNQSGDRTAADVLNHYSPEDLQAVLSEYGEVRNARTVARTIVETREEEPFRTIEQLLRTLDPLVRGQRNRYLAQLFQALRIEVNDEMGALRDLLTASLELLRPGGRLVVLSYHSLEDRMVKNFMKTGNIRGEQIKDDFGNIERPFKLITRKPVLPTEEEIARNPRARSARLRVAEKIETKA